MPSSRFDALNFSLQFLWTFGVVFAPFLCIDLMTSELVCVIIVVSHLLCILAFPGRSSALFVPVRWITNPNYNQSHIFGLVDLFSCRSQFAFLFIFTSFSSFTDAIAPLPEVKLFTLCIVCVCVSAFATHSNHFEEIPQLLVDFCQCVKPMQQNASSTANDKMMKCLNERHRNKLLSCSVAVCSLSLFFRLSRHRFVRLFGFIIFCFHLFLDSYRLFGHHCWSFTKQIWSFISCFLFLSLSCLLKCEWKRMCMRVCLPFWCHQRSNGKTPMV